MSDTPRQWSSGEWLSELMLRRGPDAVRIVQNIARRLSHLDCIKWQGSSQRRGDGATLWPWIVEGDNHILPPIGFRLDGMVEVPFDWMTTAPFADPSKRSTLAQLLQSIQGVVVPQTTGWPSFGLHALDSDDACERIVDVFRWFIGAMQRPAAVKAEPVETPEATATTGFDSEVVRWKLSFLIDDGMKSSAYGRLRLGPLRRWMSDGLGLSAASISAFPVKSGADFERHITQHPRGTRYTLGLVILTDHTVHDEIEHMCRAVVGETRYFTSIAICSRRPGEPWNIPTVIREAEAQVSLPLEEAFECTVEVPIAAARQRSRSRIASRAARAQPSPVRPPVAAPSAEERPTRQGPTSDRPSRHLPPKAVPQPRAAAPIAGGPVAGGPAGRPPPRQTQALDRLREVAERLHVEQDWLREVLWLLSDRRGVVFYGPPGTGKTHMALEIAALVQPEVGYRAVVPLHPGYTREALLNPEGGPVHTLVEAVGDARRGVLVLDDLSRVDAVSVLGELAFMLENRNVATALSSPLSVPERLMIIGTMNTADGGLDCIDQSLRRRFHFVGLFPSERPVNRILRRFLTQNHPEYLWVEDVLAEANRRLGDRFSAIGPAPFLRDTLDDHCIQRIWDHSVIPTLEARFRDEPLRLREFELDQLRAATNKRTPGGVTPIPAKVQAPAGPPTSRMRAMTALPKQATAS